MVVDKENRGTAGVARAFYPFVDNTTSDSDEGGDLAAGGRTPPLEVRYPARIAVYDDAAAAPRVVVVETQDVRSYLEEITATVVRLCKEQGGDIPFMVIREVVENYIHAYFIEPTISILDGGDTIRFSDQGPGIREKERALEYGTTSATEDMKQFIRGVGSGLPYAQQYMMDRGGSLTIEDNITGGTIVTISSVADEEAVTDDERYAYQAAPCAQIAGTYQYQQPMGGSSVAGAQYPHPSGQAGTPMVAMPYQQSGGYVVQHVPPMQMPVPRHQMVAPVPGAPNQGHVQGAAGQSVPLGITVSPRGMMVLSFLAQHDAVGPTELMRTYGSSQPTWSRELKALEAAGLVHKKKGEQKRVLTAVGRAYLLQQGM